MDLHENQINPFRVYLYIHSLYLYKYFQAENEKQHTHTNDSKSKHTQYYVKKREVCTSNRYQNLFFCFFFL